MLPRRGRLRAVALGVLTASAVAADVSRRSAWQGSGHQLDVDVHAFQGTEDRTLVRADVAGSAISTDDRLSTHMSDFKVQDSGSFLQADPVPASSPASSQNQDSRSPSWLPHFLVPSGKLQPIQWVEKIPIQLLIVPVLLGFSVLLLTFCSCFNFDGKLRGQEQQSECGQSGPVPWSALGIAALTSYRFHTGFLSATWMPYLLAMEGHHLVEQRQSFFMGTAKLIYGMSILLNPIFGLLGDQLAVASRWSGRRLFVILGVGASGLGIYGCLVAAEMGSVPWYLAGVVLWMLGEAMADITTETLVPELLPPSQYGLSSSIRSLNFLLGGLVGYAALIVFRSVDFSWLYYGYLCVMLVCAAMTLCLIDADRPKPSGTLAEEVAMSVRTLIGRAYILPANYEGGFPIACLCSFLFSLGTAPMFFLLLMVRDLVGIEDKEVLQMHFSGISIVFFVSAAVASILGAVAASKDEDQRSPDQVVEQIDERSTIVHRWRMMVASLLLFGVVAAAIPVVAVMPTFTSRTVSFYAMGVLLGLSFGSVYARFQECTWSLLPNGVDVANAMGFAAMCKLAGVGLGNFFAGMVLDLYAQGPDSYRFSGYVSMCIFCGIVVLTSTYVTFMLSRLVLRRYDEKQGRCRLPDGCDRLVAK